MAVLDAVDRAFQLRRRFVEEKLTALPSPHAVEVQFARAWDYMGVTLPEIVALVRRGMFPHALQMCRPMLEIAARSVWTFGAEDMEKAWARCQAYLAANHLRTGQDRIRAFGPSSTRIEFQRLMSQMATDDVEAMPDAIEDLLAEIISRRGWAPADGKSMANEMAAAVLPQLHMACHADEFFLLTSAGDPAIARVAAITSVMTFLILSHAALPLLRLARNPDEPLIAELMAIASGPPSQPGPEPS